MEDKCRRDLSILWILYLHGHKQAARPVRLLVHQWHPSDFTISLWHLAYLESGFWKSRNTSTSQTMTPSFQLVSQVTTGLQKWGQLSSQFVNVSLKTTIHTRKMQSMRPWFHSRGDPPSNSMFHWSQWGEVSKSGSGQTVTMVISVIFPFKPVKKSQQRRILVPR